MLMVEILIALLSNVTGKGAPAARFWFIPTVFRPERSRARFACLQQSMQKNNIR